MSTPTKPPRAPLLHPDEASVAAPLEAALLRGSSDHYKDPARYDYEYGRRREDVAFYVKLAAKHAGPILELGCGSGRLTVPLLQAGHTVVGVDASASMLAGCRSHIDKLGLAAKARLHHADFRALADPDSPLAGARYPLVICPFNAFQHLYELRSVERFFAGVHAHLAEGGLFVFDLMNPDLKYLSRDPQRRWDRTRYKDPYTKRAMTYSTQLVYDAPLQIAFMTIFHERVDGKGRARKSHLTHRHFFPRELLALVHYNGFRIERREGDFRGGALTADSEQQILRCRRKT